MSELIVSIVAILRSRSFGRGSLARSADQDDRAVRGRRYDRCDGADRRRAAGRALGRPVIIENVAGAGGNSGAALAAKAAADGYTILMATPGQAAMNQFMYKRMPYDTARSCLWPTLLGAQRSGR